MRSVLLGLIAFSVCMAAAVALYPGGTWTVPDAQGFSFWGNFWCDLLEPRSPLGRPNTASAWLARLAFGCFALSLLRFWRLTSVLVGVDRAARRAELLGRGGAWGLLFVALVPPVDWPVMHAVLVSLSALAGIVAAMLLMPALSAKDPIARLLGIGLACSSSLTLMQYLRQGITGANYADWLAGAQKFATTFLLLWMLRLLWLVRRHHSLPASLPVSSGA